MLLFALAGPGNRGSDETWKRRMGRGHPVSAGLTFDLGYPTQDTTSPAQQKLQPRPPWQRCFPSRWTLPRSYSDDSRWQSSAKVPAFDILFIYFFFLIPLCAKVCLDPVLIHLVKPSAGIIPNVSNNKISRWKVLMHLKMQDKWKNNNTKAKTNKSRLLPASTSLSRLQPHPLVF